MEARLIMGRGNHGMRTIRGGGGAAKDDKVLLWLQGRVNEAAARLTAVMTRFIIHGVG